MAHGAVRLRGAYAFACPPQWALTPEDYLQRTTPRPSSPVQAPPHGLRRLMPRGQVGVARPLAAIVGFHTVGSFLDGFPWLVVVAGATPLIGFFSPPPHPFLSGQAPSLVNLNDLQVLDDISGLDRTVVSDLEQARARLQERTPEAFQAWWEAVSRARHEHSLRVGRTFAPPPPPSGIGDLWGLARARHERVIEAWTAMVTDPLAALSHSSLFDTANTWTAAFIGIYGRASDFIAVHGTEPPADRTLIDSYAALTREVESAWQSALIRAERSDLDWLPPAERADADRARRLLTLASDEAASLAERANAAQKAADLLRKVHSFVLPATTLTAIEAGTRPQLG
jgi:hypothetical protein